MAGFILRLVAYALLLGLTSRTAAYFWSANGLDGIAALQPLYDGGMKALLFGPLFLALFGFGALRDVCVFAGCALAGAALTAPFVIARVAGA